ncbi:UNVERIFIED_ORG: AraC-like DNA-binding protein [Rahnella aquatilis]|jgi:AraC-like DNA-binding protein|uniref:helix-turn-helix transcriptional regulator n=1 Tax=Rahnella sp. 2050 TaxID=3156425 RepID=UPI001B430854|nr:AraC-like DNA-binding protein [Rahnella aquatilis]
MSSEQHSHAVSLLPNKLPVSHDRQFSRAEPYLQQPHQVSNFRFFEPSLLRVNSGQLALRHENGTSVQLGNSEHLIVVSQHTLAHVSKTPDAANGFFSSLYLGFSPALVAEFYRDNARLLTALSPLNGFETLPLDDELRDTLDFCLRGIGNPASHTVQRNRLTAVLIALAERRILFMPRAAEPLGTRLTALLAAAPEFAWTAASASQQLAMSEATLRRRLVEEQISFRTLLQDIRMHHAITLLQTTRWNLSQIADACGYRASSRFSLRFKERFGCSPADIR